MSAKTIRCDYCGKPAPLVTGKTLFPTRPDIWERRFYVCRPCGAWVGCHKRTDVPFGRLANAELRMWRQEAHAAFDPLWGHNPKGGPKDRAAYSRTAAYRWLAAKLGIHPDKCHVGLFGVDECRRTIAACEEFRAYAADQADARERARRINSGRRRA